MLSVYLFLFFLWKNKQFTYFIFHRSVPTSNNTSQAYHWPTSPILPPISSRTPHLVPETYTMSLTSANYPESSAIPSSSMYQNTSGSNPQTGYTTNNNMLQLMMQNNKTSKNKFGSWIEEESSSIFSNDGTNTNTSPSEYYTATDSTATEFSTTSSNSPKSLSSVDGVEIDCVTSQDEIRSNTYIKFNRKSRSSINQVKSPSSTRRPIQKNHFISAMAYARAFEKK